MQIQDLKECGKKSLLTTEIPVKILCCHKMKLDDIFILMDTQESYIDSGKFFVGYVYDKHILYFCSFKAFKTNSIRYFDELKFLLLMMYD